MKKKNGYVLFLIIQEYELIKAYLKSEFKDIVQQFKKLKRKTLKPDDTILV